MTAFPFSSMGKFSGAKVGFFVSMLLFLQLFFITELKAIDAQFRYCVFQQPEKGPYLETYLTVNSRSIAFVSIGENQLQGAIELTIDFSRNDTIVLFDKYTLRSPVIDTNTKTQFAFLDLQRFGLPAGVYTMNLKIVDVNDTSNHAFATENVLITAVGNQPAFSGIMLSNRIEAANGKGNLTKNGFDFEPRASTFYGNGQDTMQYYFELYGTQSILPDSLLIVRSWIETQQGQVVPNTSRFYKKSPKQVLPIAEALLIDEIPSGNYALKLELRNRNNELLAVQQLEFQRMNTLIQFDEQKLLAAKLGGTFVDDFDRKKLIEQIRSVRPISQHSEREYADNMLNNKSLDDEFYKRYLISFWEKRDPVNPRAAWARYQEQVDAANSLFSSKITKGYETERGRVYLQYGAPNSRTVVDNEPSAYPYEIWWYYEYQGQRNIRFVFYNPDLITNDYQLLHSEALGETFDPQWRLILFSRTTAFQNLDETQNRDHFGTRLEDNFRNQ